MCSQASQQGRLPDWLKRELLPEIRGKTRVYALWKKGQATQEEYKG